MRKLIIFLVTGILWCNVVHATAESLFNSYWKRYWNAYHECINTHKFRDGSSLFFLDRVEPEPIFFGSG